MSGPPRGAAPLAWSQFLAEDFGEVEWLAGRLLTRGQQITLIGDGKVGKSVFAQEWAWRMAAGLPFLGDVARSPVRVLYVDQENDHGQIQERMLSFGAMADTLSGLVYLSFPDFRPLDTPVGACDLVGAVEYYRAEVVVLDTVSRMITGAENESDTWLALYRHTTRALKRAGVASIRLDHFGKDPARGGRGSSAKTQDVDHVWEMVATGRGSPLLSLTRTHTRTGIGEGELMIRRQGKAVGDRWEVGSTCHTIAGQEDRPPAVPDRLRGYRPSARRVLAVLEAATAPLTVRQIGGLLAADTDVGPLTRRTIQDALAALREGALAVEIEATPGLAASWEVIRS